MMLMKRHLLESAARLIGLAKPPATPAEAKAAEGGVDAKLADAERRLAEAAAEPTLGLSEAEEEARDRRILGLTREAKRLREAKAELARAADELAAAEEAARLDRLAVESAEAKARGVALLERHSARLVEQVADFRELRAVKALVKKNNYVLKAGGREAVKDPEAIAGAEGRAWTSVLDATLFDPIARRIVWPPAAFNPVARAMAEEAAKREEDQAAAAVLAAAGGGL